MELALGFLIGAFWGAVLWWQALRQQEELWDEYCRLTRELMLTRRQLQATDRTVAHGRAGFNNHDQARMG